VKQCSKCGEIKLETEFYRKRNGLCARCIECQRETRKAYYLRIKATQSPEERRWKVIGWKYGLTEEEWNGLFLKQNNVCALCHSPYPRSKKGWHTDHDHETGKVRGILCFPCNYLLGKVETAGWMPPSTADIEAYFRESNQGVGAP
jgi:recombination endonuclease VII